MPKVIITCESVNNVKPTITANPSVGGEVIEDLVSPNSVTILMGEEVNTPQKFFTAVRDMADRYIGELRFEREERVFNRNSGAVNVDEPGPIVLVGEQTAGIENVQWVKDGVFLGGETNLTLTIDPSDPADNGVYFLRGFYDGGEKKTDSATSVVTVTPL